MDRLDAMRLFTRIVERSSFSRASEDLDLPRSTATEAVKQLEARLGVRLLQRTTRRVTPTLDGEAYYHRCLSIIAEIEEAEGAFAGVNPKGLLRVDVEGSLARHFVMPQLPQFLAEFPDIEICLSEGDQPADLDGKGVDCALRLGAPQGGDLMSRQVAMLDQVTLAAPGYLAQFGIPQNLEALSGHRMVGFRSGATEEVSSLQFTVEGRGCEITLPSSLSVNGVESCLSAARAGLGLVQIPRCHAVADLLSGVLVEVMPETPPVFTPVCLLYPRNSPLSPQVRVFMDWLEALFPRHTPAPGGQYEAIRTGGAPLLRVPG